MSIFQPPCVRCEEVPADAEWQRASPCSSCVPIRVFKEIQFDPEGDLEVEDIPGLLVMAADAVSDPAVHRMLVRARSLLQSGVVASQDLLHRLDRLLNECNNGTDSPSRIVKEQRS